MDRSVPQAVVWMLAALGIAAALAAAVTYLL
jgi:hypothetical protein